MRNFDNQKYLDSAKTFLRESIQNNQSVYLHFGGKLKDDQHTARVLPGYDPDLKLKLLKAINEDYNAVFLVSGQDLDRGRIRGDNGLDYVAETKRAIDELISEGIKVGNIVVMGKPINIELDRYANSHNLKINYWEPINLRGDVTDIFVGKNPSLDTSKRLKVVISPGSNSGKFEYCIESVLKDTQAGKKTSYIRVHTFPVKELSPIHPLNMAYFAASADVFDHVWVLGISSEQEKAEAWKQFTRDEDIDRVLTAISKKSNMLSAETFTGVSVFSGILNDLESRKDGAAEVFRRYIRYADEVRAGKERKSVLDFVEKLVLKIIDYEKSKQ